MGRKKKKISKPWCWYCNRDFEDEKILIQHQKAKHFKCHICNKKLFTGPGLAIHCMQVHKETIDKIPGAVPGRDNVNIEIFGMEGVPMDAEIGVVASEEHTPAKQSKIAVPPQIAMPPGFPPIPPFGIPPGLPPFMPMFMPPVPTTLPEAPPLPSGLQTIAPPVPGLLSGISAGIPPPLPPGAPTSSISVAFPAYQQQASIKAELEQPTEPTSAFAGPPPVVTGSSGTITIKPITTRTRIVCPDEIISLEEHKYQMVQRANPYASGMAAGIVPSSVGVGARGAMPPITGRGFFR